VGSENKNPLFPSLGFPAPTPYTGLLPLADGGIRALFPPSPLTAPDVILFFVIRFSSLEKPVGDIFLLSVAFLLGFKSLVPFPYPASFLQQLSAILIPLLSYGWT